jgi:hypothetical protein
MQGNYIKLRRDASQIGLEWFLQSLLREKSKQEIK